MFCWRSRAGEEALEGFLEAEGNVKRDGAVDGNRSGDVFEKGWVGADGGWIAGGEDIDADVVSGEIASEAGDAQHVDSADGRKCVVHQQDVEAHRAIGSGVVIGWLGGKVADPFQVYCMGSYGSRR